MAFRGDAEMQATRQQVDMKTRVYRRNLNTTAERSRAEKRRMAFKKQKQVTNKQSNLLPNTGEAIASSFPRAQSSQLRGWLSSERLCSLIPLEHPRKHV